MKKPGKSPAAKTTGTSPQCRICFERILPDHLDPERHARRAMRSLMTEGTGRGLDPDTVIGRSRMALVLSKKWETGSTLKCRFLDGSAALRKKVEAAAREWEKHANIRFRFVASGDAEIRISFRADPGSWSAVGRDALNTAYFPAHTPTMNFGWLTDRSSSTEIRGVVLHEFGHALGCVHEHQSPKFERKWNKRRVLEDFQGPPNYWSPEEIDANVLEKYSPRGLRATRYDPDSIMLYMFDAGLFSDGQGATNENNNLSKLDKEFIRQLYPKS